MKLKEILMNKWGWAGAIIGFIAMTIFLGLWGHWFDFQLMNKKTLIIFIVIGFIAGLIAQKLWRKFK